MQVSKNSNQFEFSIGSFRLHLLQSDRLTCLEIWFTLTVSPASDSEGETAGRAGCLSPMLFALFFSKKKIGFRNKFLGFVFSGVF